ncbi:MAG TPA: hypothetical protein VEA99_16950 [Gemmatimonadaceae bacterium]|nr:hypothetical protein [Gemmatimonadaceae bacterium]
MRQLRWIAGLALLASAACSNPAEPEREARACGDPRRPCDQLLGEITDRTDTPYLADPNTIVIGDAVVRRP